MEVAHCRLIFDGSFPDVFIGAECNQVVQEWVGKANKFHTILKGFVADQHVTAVAVGSRR
jgi:hypothetical protein